MTAAKTPAAIIQTSPATSARPNKAMPSIASTAYLTYLTLIMRYLPMRPRCCLRYRAVRRSTAEKNHRSRRRPSTSPRSPAPTARASSSRERGRVPTRQHGTRSSRTWTPPEEKAPSVLRAPGRVRWPASVPSARSGCIRGSRRHGCDPRGSCRKRSRDASTGGGIESRAREPMRHFLLCLVQTKAGYEKNQRTIDASAIAMLA